MIVPLPVVKLKLKLKLKALAAWGVDVDQYQVVETTALALNRDYILYVTIL
jgi:hypothetical protein